MLATTPFDVVTFGETMVLLTPMEPSTLDQSNGFKTAVAGTESNCAIGLARLGHSVAWVSRLGKDPFGKKILRTIRGEGVDVARVEMDTAALTGLMFKETGGSGQPHVYYYRKGSAASRLHSKLFEGLVSRFLFVTGITPALSEQNRELTLQVVDQFKSGGTTVVFDPNMRYKLWSAEAAREVFLQVAHKCDVLLPSLEEAKILSGLSSLEDMAVALLQLGPKRVAIKAGDQGSYFADDETRGFVPPFRVREVDPVGAGDAYCAGVISGLLDNLPFREAVERGCAMGAICVMSYADYAAPDREELEGFLKGTRAQAR